MDNKGNLYGSTNLGGVRDGGTVFELSRGANGKWTHAVLYDFCIKRHCADGSGHGNHIGYAGEASGRPYDGASRIYGTTLSAAIAPTLRAGRLCT